MSQTSAGLLMYRISQDLMQYFLVHPGGPIYRNKNEGVWSIPKGLAEPGEDLLAAAQREFEEETGIEPHGAYTNLGTTKLKNGKIIHAWAFPGEWDQTNPIKSNTFQMEWPPRSSKFIDVPEADRADWFLYEAATRFIHAAQVVFIDRLREILSMPGT